MQDSYHFEDVSLLITHYNRSKSLERLLNSFAQQRCSFKEIIVSDDCSKQEHIDYMKELNKEFDFKLITAPQNGGLGQNINKGQDAIKTEYTLYVQEDFVILPDAVKHLINGRKILDDDSGLDMVRFYSYLNYPRLRPYKLGFSEMIFKLWGDGLDKIPLYSDHPHMRRSNFLEKFGRYPEGKNPENTEYDMMLSVLKRKGRGLLFTNYKSVFEQINTSSEPSTMKRKFWRYSQNFAITMAVTSYRYIKFYYNYFMMSK
ncbi:Glycosyltransferase involved in cell wall bisynthesis [bacterium A37T11]|nr:Glycosyltransferase involved in cell wall bisynthesis [bacterium A37T11]